MRIINIYNIILVLVIASVSPLLGQNNGSLTLQFCQEQAVVNFPSIKDKASLQAASALKISNVEVGKLPQLSLNGQASYQSEGIDITLPLPTGTKSMSQAKDQYKVTLEVNQLLYDGGTVRYQRKLEESSFAADAQQVEVDLYKLKEQVNNVFFVLVSLQENRKLLNVALNEILEKEKVVESSVKNGVLTSSDLDVLAAERLKVEQQLVEVDINRQTSMNILSILINQPVNESTKLELPVLFINDSAAINRPEYKWFDLQTQRIDDSKQLTGSVLKPKVYAFAQAGYGKPGLNMFSDKFSPYYIVGATAKWNIWDWNKNSRDRQVLDIQKQMVVTRRESFDKNLTIDLQNRLSAIHKLEESIKRDTQIVVLRTRVVRSASSRLDHGVITSTDYLTELNAETTAKLNFETHKILLLQAKANYLVTKGGEGTK
jgi:outer membrane protein TolC